MKSQVVGVKATFCKERIRGCGVRSLGVQVPCSAFPHQQVQSWPPTCAELVALAERTRLSPSVTGHCSVHLGTFLCVD